MSKDTIYRQDAIDAVNMGAFSAATIYGRTDKGSAALYETVKAIKALPSAQPNKGYIEQIKWERDIAIQQLKELGYGLGEKIRKDVEVIRCKDCKHWMNEHLCKKLSAYYGSIYTDADFFCGDAERRSE